MKPMHDQLQVQDAVPAAALGTAEASRSSQQIWDSALYVGWIRHRRYFPKAHAFRYRLFLLYLDLAEVEQLFDRRWLWSVGRRNLAEFRRSDYLGDADVPLDIAVRDCVERSGHERPRGPIRLLAHLRYFGKCFNPVSIYYCFHEDGHTLQTVVAEITNTPWNERHAYVLPVAQARLAGGVYTWRFDKRFHVSPFMGMEHEYGWRLSVPGPGLRVHMDVLQPEAGPAAGRREFDATLVLERRPATSSQLAGALLRFPLMTLRILFAIHWQALRLWLRGNPVHDHPGSKVSSP